MAEAFTAGVRPGGLTDDTHIRMLLCYLVKVAGPVKRETMQGALLQEQLVNYFEFADALAEVEKQQLLADARKQADAIVAAGKASAEAERQSKLREADAQTTALARAMCEKLLARNLTAQDDARLLDDLLEKAGAGNGN